MGNFVVLSWNWFIHRYLIQWNRLSILRPLSCIGNSFVILTLITHYIEINELRASVDVQSQLADALWSLMSHNRINISLSFIFFSSKPILTNLFFYFKKMVDDFNPLKFLLSFLLPLLFRGATHWHCLTLNFP